MLSPEGPPEMTDSKFCYEVKYRLRCHFGKLKPYITQQAEVCFWKNWPWQYNNNRALTERMLLLYIQHFTDVKTYKGNFLLLCYWKMTEMYMYLQHCIGSKDINRDGWKYWTVPKTHTTPTGMVLYCLVTGFHLSLHAALRNVKIMWEFCPDGIRTGDFSIWSPTSRPRLLH